MFRKRFALLLACCVSLGLQSQVFAVSCGDDPSDLCLWFNGCHYYGTAVVTAGPTDCKQNALRSEKTVSCPSEPGPKTCNFTRQESTTTKYSFSGEVGVGLTYVDFGLAANYATETTVQIGCNPNTTIGPLTCNSPYPPNQTCCDEYWETRRDTTLKKQVYDKEDWNPFGDYGYCEPGNQYGGTYCCDWEGTLKHVVQSNCSDCTALPACNP